MPEAVAEPVAPPPRSSGKLWMIVLAVVLAVSLGAGGVYFMTSGNDDTSQDEEADGKAKTSGKKAADKKPKAPAIYIKLDPAFVSNFEARGSMRFLQVSVEVMTRDVVTADLLKQHDPMVRNDLLMLFGNQTYETISTHEGKEQLRAAALEAVRKVVKAESGDSKQVEQLYFTSFVMQ